MAVPFEIPFPWLRLFAQSVLRAFAFECRGLEYLRQVAGGCILAGNHAGLLDSLMVLAACDHRFRFLMTESVFEWGLIGKAVPYANIIPLHKGREGRALVESIRRLRNGERLCIFPEGKLTLDGQLDTFNEGVAFLQEKSGVPIIPFALQGSFEIWPITRQFPAFGRKIKLSIQFGEPLPAGSFSNRQECVQGLKNKVQTMLQGSFPAKLSSTGSLGQFPI